MPRRYTVVDGTTVLGWSGLERRFGARDAAAGFFHPEPIFEIYRHIFDLYRAAGSDPVRLAAYVRARDALGLRVSEVPGGPFPATLDLIFCWPDGRYALHITTTWQPFWELASDEH